MKKILIFGMVLGMIGIGSVYGAGSNSPALIILDCSDFSSMQEARRFLEERGGRLVHLYPTHIMVGNLPEGMEQDLIGQSGITAIHRTMVDPSIVRGYGQMAVYAVEAWNNNFMGLAKMRGLTPEAGLPEPGPILNDMRTVPKSEMLPRMERPLEAPHGSGFYDVSEYLIGDVAVGIILPESNGGTDTQTEDWTTARASNVVTEIQAGIDSAVTGDTVWVADGIYTGTGNMKIFYLLVLGIRGIA